jgi:hypothetical protein
MYDDMIEGGGGGGGLPPRRGTRLAAELDRRLAGNEPLDKIICWWDDSWRAAIRLREIFPHGDENVQPRNFSDNERACFVIVITSGCGGEADETDEDKATRIHTAKQLAGLQRLWIKLGFEGAKMVDPAYAEAVRDKYWTTLENARTALQAGQ